MLYIEYYTVSVALSGDGSLIPNAGWRHTDSTITLPIIDHFLAGDKKNLVTFCTITFPKLHLQATLLQLEGFF